MSNLNPSQIRAACATLGSTTTKKKIRLSWLLIALPPGEDKIIKSLLSKVGRCLFDPHLEASLRVAMTSMFVLVDPHGTKITHNLASLTTSPPGEEQGFLGVINIHSISGY